MNAKKRFPELAHLTNEEIRKLLRRSTLSREDRHIAACCLCWDMDDVDTAEAVHMHRTTVGRHLRGVIVPELERLINRQEKKCAGD